MRTGHRGAWLWLAGVVGVVGTAHCGGGSNGGSGAKDAGNPMDTGSSSGSGSGSSSGGGDASGVDASGSGDGGDASPAPDATPDEGGADASTPSDSGGSEASTAHDAGDAAVGCDPVGTTVTVDPVNGVDGAASGSGTKGGTSSGPCAFKTITYALGHLRGATTVVLIGGDYGTTADGYNGETFPLNIPDGVTIQDATAIPEAIIHVGEPQTASSGVGFAFVSGAASVQDVEIWGVGGTLGTTTNAVVVLGGTLSLSNVEIGPFGGDCVLAQGGALTVLNSIVEDCGGSGVHVTGTAQANITGSGTFVEILDNGLHGVLVDGTASANLSYVETVGNTAHGVVFQPSSASVAQSTVTNLSSRGNLNGAKFEAPAYVKVRSSNFTSNTDNGIWITSGTVGGKATSDVSGVDLGDSTQDPGKNVIQEVGFLNGYAGLCFGVAASGGTTLRALGNQWVAGGANVDCSTGASVSNALSEAATKTNCSGGTSIGGPGLGGSNVIDTGGCGCGNYVSCN